MSRLKPGICLGRFGICVTPAIGHFCKVIDMGKTASVFVIAAAAFGAGAAAGLLFAPASGEENRRRLSIQVKAQTASLEQQVKDVEKNLSILEDQVKASGQQLGSRVKSAATSAMDRLIPEAEKDVPWEIDNADLATDLPHLPKF